MDQHEPAVPPRRLVDALDEARADVAAGRTVSGEDVRAGLRAAIARMRADARDVAELRRRYGRKNRVESAEHLLRAIADAKSRPSRR